MGTDLKPIDKFELALQQEWGGEILSVLPRNIEPEKFMTMAVTAARRVPKLLQCSRTSLQVSLLECARVGLYPDGKEAAIIPYGGQAEFMPMTQGIINLILRSPGVEKVEARAVREGDEFDYRYGANPDLRHRPGKGADDREVLAAYAVVWRQGTSPTFEVVDREEIEAARLTSRAPESLAWTKWYSEMARKVALKRLSKYLDLSPEASRAIEIDHAVVGDPNMEGGYDGPSPEFERQLVKDRTQDRIAQLKSRLNGPEEQEQDGDEEEPAAEEDADSEASAPRDPKAVPGYKLRQQVKADPTSVQATEYWGYVRRMSIDKDEAKATLTECSERYADALLVLLNSYEELEAMDLLTDEQLAERGEILAEESESEEEDEA